ncbi:uncharacterized protein METZ01_LOCUS213862, partial [marine metagenome]
KVNVVNRQKLTPLIAAAYNGDPKTVQLLLSHGADPTMADQTGKTALVYASGKGFSKIVGLLLDTGIDTNIRYGNELTILMWASGHSDDVPSQAALNTVKLILSKGAIPDLADKRGQTALMIAAEMGHLRIVEHLLAIGAKADLQDDEGRTAFDLAESADHSEVSELLR